MLQEKKKWVCGAVMRLLGGRRRAGNYKIKCDGDTRQETSHEGNLLVAPPMGEEDGESNAGSESGSLGGGYQWQ